jgi:TfdA family taurine catabolism dioxygenase TauD
MAVPADEPLMGFASLNPSYDEETRMRFIPVGREFAAAVVDIDLRAPLDATAVAAVHAAMDRHAVLVFHDQPLTDEQQIAFTKSLGKIELNTANNVTRLDQRRLSIEMSDISNLDQHSNLLARDDRRRAFNLGNRLWHSDSSFKAVPAKYSLLSARLIPWAGGDTEFADMRAAYDALDPETKAEIEDLVTEHSLLFSRGQLGFADFTAEERVKFAPVRHVWCGPIRRPAASRYSCRRTSAASSAGRYRRRSPSCAISPSMRPSGNSFTPTPGGNMIS